MLPRLARLGLCEQWHQNQLDTVIRGWSQVIDDVVKAYENSEDLKRHNADLRRALDDLRPQLEPMRVDMATSRERISLLVEQVDQAASQIIRERQSFEEYKRDAEASRAEESEVIRDLHLKLAEERQGSAQRNKDLEKVKVERDASDTQAHILQTQLANERQAAELLRKDVNEAIISRNNALAEIEGLQLERLTKAMNDSEALSEEMDNLRQQPISEHQRSEQLSNNLSVAGKRREVLSEELAEVRSKLGTERQNTEQMKAGLEGAWEGQSVLSEELERAQSKLETDRRQPKSQARD